MRVILFWLAMLFGGAALAAPSCPISADLSAPPADKRDEEVRRLPIGGYTLATLWMPQHCRAAVRGVAGVACGRAELRAGGLTLHGLWPDGTGRSWPQWCAPTAPVARATIAAHYCATPSPSLIQHEWAKHGTCMPGYTPERYFDRAEQLYRAIRIPDLKAMSYSRPTVASVKRAIADTNPGLTPAMFKLNLDERGWLEEIWFCLDTNFARKACEGSSRQRADDPVRIWRGGRSQGGS